MFKFDAPNQFQLGFQNPATPIATGIADLHDSIFLYLLFILIGVIYFFIKIISRSITQWENPNKEHITHFRKDILEITNLVHGTAIEIIWTITPAIILMMIAVPSFALLYSIDEIIDPMITLKATGSQWFWTYEYVDMSSDDIVKADSYMLPSTDLHKGDFRLLEVDQALTCPIEWHLRVIITATDVLHSFAVPSLGIKVDAVPGRLNQTSLYIQREGIFYGQCSELCGVNHGFMPIKIEAIADDSETSPYTPDLIENAIAPTKKTPQKVTSKKPTKTLPKKTNENHSKKNQQIIISLQAKEPILLSVAHVFLPAYPEVKLLENTPSKFKLSIPIHLRGEFFAYLGCLKPLYGVGDLLIEIPKKEKNPTTPEPITPK